MRTTPILVPALLCLALFQTEVRSYNHPEIRWLSVTTDHFVIHYYNRTEPAVYAAWKTAEEAYAVLAPLYDHVPRRKINLALADHDDFSNGFAAWLDGAIMIWVPESRFELRGNTVWLRNVISHELAHILSLEKKRSMQMVDWTLSARFERPGLSLSWDEPLARMTFYPNWLAEGLAQDGAQRMNADCWDSRRDMVLRCAMLDGKQLSLAEMGVFNHDGLRDEMIYNQGYSFTKFLKETVGEERLVQIIRDGTQDRFTLEPRFRYRTGQDIRALYDAWVAHNRARYERQAPKEPTAGKPVWAGGAFNHQPRISRDGAFRGWLTSHKDDFYRTDLVIMRDGENRPVNRIRYAQTSWDFSPDGRQVYYIKAYWPDRTGSLFNDLYVQPSAGGPERRLTRGGRIYDVAASPDGKTLAITRYHDGVYSLETFSLESGTYSPVIKGEPGAPFMSPAYHPTDPDRLAIVRIVDGKAGLHVVDLKAKTVTPLLVNGAQQESPFWARDGRVFFSADYDGIFDIYSVAPDGAGLARHSRTAGGFFSPCVAADGGILAASYSSSGFSIVTFAPADEAAPAAADAPCDFDSLPRPKGRVKIKSRPYEAKLLRPVWELNTFAYGMLGDTLNDEPEYHVEAGAGIVSQRSDALGKKSMYFGIYGGVITEPGAPADTAGDSATLRFQDHAAASRRTDDRRMGPGPNPWAVKLRRHLASTAYRRTLSQFPMVQGDTGAVSGTTVMMLLNPILGFANSRHAATFGLDASVQLLMVIPVDITLLPFLEWQLGKDLYLGFSPYIDIMPFNLAFIAETPLWLGWVHDGYYHRHVSYTYRNVTRLYGALSPLFIFPVAVNGDDGTAAVASGIGPTIALVHGVPVARSASIVLEAMATATYFNGVLELYALPQPTRELYAADLSLSLRFPVVPKINRGTVLYWDALYGSIGYGAELIAGEELFSPDGTHLLRHNALIDDTTDNVIIGQNVRAVLTAGTYKHAMFFRTMAAAVAYDFVSEKVQVDVSFGF